jgi:hypothetical protein
VESRAQEDPTIEDFLKPDEMNALRTRPAAGGGEPAQEAGAKVESLMADPAQAESFVTRTGVDSLAAATGSIHGMWDDIWPPPRSHRAGS